MTVDLYVLIVNWNVRDRLKACLESIYVAPGGRLDAGVLHLGAHTVRVCVVDNASADNSTEMVRQLFPQVDLIASRENLGFTGGNNVALRRWLGGDQAGSLGETKHGQPRHVLMLNPDTRVVGDALECMVDYMDEHEEVGALGPLLRYADGSIQSSRRRFPSLMTALTESTLLERWFPENQWARSYRMAELPNDETLDVDWVVGACLLARWETIAQVGVLDERFFMYSEELDWCRRAKSAGWRIVFFPHATIVHYEGQSSGQVVAARHIRFNSSKVSYFRKHHNALEAEALRLFLLGTFFLQLAGEAGKYLAGHKRELRKERMTAYLQVLRSGLRSRGAG